MKARLPRNLAETCMLFAGWSIFVGAIVLLGWLRGEPPGRATLMVETVLVAGFVVTGVALLLRRSRRPRTPTA